MSGKDDDDIEIRLMTRDDAESFRVALEYYYKEEPSLIATDTKVPEDIGEDFDQYMDKLCGNGVSLCAMDRKTGVMAGFRLTNPVKRTDPEVNDCTTAGRDMNTIGIFECYTLGTQILYNEVDVFERYGVDIMLHFVGLCVIPQYQRRGLAMRLILASIDRARRQGYKLICADASSDYSRRCFDKLGFEYISGITFEEYKKLGFPFVKDFVGQHSKQTLHCLYLEVE